MQDELHRVPISACNNVPAHRPLSVYVQLDQLYGSGLEEDDGSHSSEFPRNMVSAVIVEPSPEDRHVCEQVSLNESKRNRSMLVWKLYFFYPVFHSVLHKIVLLTILHITNLKYVLVNLERSWWKYPKFIFLKIATISIPCGVVFPFISEFLTIALLLWIQVSATNALHKLWSINLVWFQTWNVQTETEFD